MMNNRFDRLSLAADLAICSLWLLCINHELYFVPHLTMLLLVRIWLSFSMYRHSRMAVCPIVMLAAITVYICADSYGASYELFLMPWMTLARGALSLFGESRGNVDALIDLLLDRGWSMRQCINAAALAGSVWLFILPACVYICRFVRKRLQPGRLTLRKNMGLCAYLLGIMLLMNILHVSRISVFIFFLALLMVPFFFNHGNVKDLFSRGETAFMATLAILAAGYVSGIGMDDKAVIAAGLLPAAFYMLVNWWLQRDIRYREILPIIIGSACFAAAQYTSDAARAALLQTAATLTAIVVFRFAADTRKYWTGAGLFIMTALVIPVLCIGYNPYSVMSAKRMYVCHDYIRSPDGLLYVHGKQGCGIRDRYGLVMPAEYDGGMILQAWLPYYKVQKAEKWQIYDIERRELVSSESFSDILPYNDTTFVLKSDAADRYLILPGHYDRRAKSQQAVITDNAPTEK